MLENVPTTAQFIIGVAVIVAVVVAAIILAVRSGQQHAAKVAAEVIQNVFNSPVILELARGSTVGIPQETFEKVISSLQTGRTFAPDPDFKALLAVLEHVARKLDKDPLNDPVGNVPLPAAPIPALPTGGAETIVNG